MPSQLLVERQLPPEPHSGLIQHLTLSGSLGQKPERKDPSAAAQFVVVTQTPGVPSIEQGPFGAARERGRRGRRNAREYIVAIFVWGKVNSEVKVETMRLLIIYFNTLYHEPHAIPAISPL